MSDRGELVQAVTHAIAGIGDEHDMQQRREIAKEIVAICAAALTDGTEAP